MNPRATIFRPVRAEDFRSRPAQLGRSSLDIVNHEPNHGSRGEVAVVLTARPEHLNDTTVR